MSRPLLIVVHPGSLCGSLDMHWGAKASSIRENIANEITAFKGDIAIIENDLSDELEHHPHLISRDANWFDGEPMDDELPSAVRGIVSTYGLNRKSNVTITGAWVYADGEGCVDFVRRSLCSRGIPCSVSDCAATDFSYIR